MDMLRRIFKLIFLFFFFLIGLYIYCAVLLFAVFTDVFMYTLTGNFGDTIESLDEFVYETLDSVINA